MKKATVPLLALASLMMFAAVAPVMAIGPEQAFDVGNNPNLWIGGGAIHNDHGEAGGNILWYKASSGYSGKWLLSDPTSGEGKMNDAIIATISIISQFAADQTAFLSGNPTVNENKWIFLSPDGSGNQFAYSSGPFAAYGSHGILWWLMFFGPAQRNATQASTIAANYPNGLFWNYNFVKM
jgi:hypothetical protein